ncbi:hypothetical protein [Winogradskyella sp.]|uniref:hypothetical protein n=1 Tax=Winogradskyella sp. TaxID=1883156 RepID=UPI0026075BC5|nr:hypothetical protein [Winogradskyella sp.]
MKHLRTLIACFVILVIPTTVVSQDTFSKTTSELVFEGSSEERFIETYVTEDALSLHFIVNCKLTEGLIAVEITNAETGKNYGAFTIGGSKSDVPNQSSSVKENVLSDINKVIKSPATGYYRIKVKAKNAKAQLKVIVEQFYN